MTHSTLLAPRAKTSFSLLSLLLVLVTVLAACGGSSTAQKKAASTTLTIQSNQSGDYPRNFNPFSANVISGTQGVIYETLLYVNRLNGDVTPWLAQSYNLASDAKSITFHLRKGVVWSDGQPFTSDDVVFTLNLLKQNSALDLTGIDGYIQSVTAPDASTVQVTMNKAFFPITWLLGGQVYILSKHAWSSVKGDPSQYADPNPIGTGPYVVKSFTPQLVILTKNAKFWQPGKPEVAEIKIPSYSSNTSAELALEKNQIDWTNLFIPNVDKNYVNLDKQHNHYWYPSSDIVMLYLNLKRYPFNLLPVRQAISDAIDREQINKIGESGYEPAASPTGLLAEQKSYLDPQYADLSFQARYRNSDAASGECGF